MVCSRFVPVGADIDHCGNFYNYFVLLHFDVAPFRIFCKCTVLLYFGLGSILLYTMSTKRLQHSLRIPRQHMSCILQQTCPLCLHISQQHTLYSYFVLVDFDVAPFRNLCKRYWMRLEHIGQWHMVCKSHQ